MYQKFRLLTISTIKKEINSHQTLFLDHERVESASARDYDKSGITYTTYVNEGVDVLVHFYWNFILLKFCIYQS